MEYLSIVSQNKKWTSVWHLGEVVQIVSGYQWIHFDPCGILVNSKSKQKMDFGMAPTGWTKKKKTRSRARNFLTLGRPNFWFGPKWFSRRGHQHIKKSIFSIFHDTHPYPQKTLFFPETGSPEQLQGLGSKYSRGLQGWNLGQLMTYVWPTSPRLYFLHQVYNFL